MQSTRQHILDTLDQRGTASAGQLAHAFGMTAANLRRHLGILRSHNLVAVVGRRQGGGRGRPEAIYALSATGQGAGLERLTRALLAEAATKESAATTAGVRNLARRLLGGQEAPFGSLTQRLVATVKQLSPLNYRPHWEAKQRGPELVLGRCPYAAIIADHPVLCEMDAQLVEGLLGTPVELASKLQPGPQGTPQCNFVMKREQVT
jgi:predicted ArsR family transcriptional regulator